MGRCKAAGQTEDGERERDRMGAWACVCEVGEHADARIPAVIT